VLAKEKTIYTNARIRIIEAQLTNSIRYRVFIKMKGSGKGLYLGSYDDIQTAKREGENAI
jgi:hypothetical protein